MPYHLIPGERVPAGVQRIVREEIESAVGQLTGKGESDLDEAIHEARKNIKKIRGVLRLVRPQLGEVYTQENIHFRDIGHLLSEFRDAGAILETFDALRRKYRAELVRGGLASIRRVDCAVTHRGVGGKVVIVGNVFAKDHNQVLDRSCRAAQP